MTHREKVARNFIETRGMETFRRLLFLFEKQESGEVIAKEFGVSRERIRQWRDTFGSTIYVYEVHPIVVLHLNEKRSPKEQSRQTGRWLP